MSGLHDLQPLPCGVGITRCEGGSSFTQRFGSEGGVSHKSSIHNQNRRFNGGLLAGERAANNREASFLIPLEPRVTLALYTLFGARLALGLGVATSV